MRIEMKTPFRLFLCLAMLFTTTASWADCLREVELRCNDLAYDVVTRRIYASIPGSVPGSGNSVVTINPETGQVGAPIFIGSEPGRLAISDAGGILWVWLEGAAAVRRFDTETGTPGLQFWLGQSNGPPLYAEDMAAMPGRPETVAISRRNRSGSPGHVNVVIYDNGVQRPNVAAGANLIEFSDRGDRLYGYNRETTAFGFFRWAVNERGILPGDVIPLFYANQDFVAEGGRVYTSSGGVYDPEAGHPLGQLPHGLHRPDTKHGQVYVLQQEDRRARLMACDRETFRLLWQLPIAGIRGHLRSLIRWGDDGLAFHTSEGQVFLLRISEAALAANSFSFVFDPTGIPGGTSATGTVTLSGPAPAGGATLTLLAANPVLVTVPATVTVPGGAMSASFPVTTRLVSRNTPVDVTATFCGVNRTATLELQPLPPPTAPGNLLLNGSFEAPDVSMSPSAGLLFGPGGLPGRPTAGAVIPGWRIPQGTIDVYGSHWAAADGRQSIDLVGDNPGSIEQTFPTDPGREYLFTGWIAHNPDNPYLPEGRANVYIDNVFLTQLAHREAGATRTAMRWNRFSVRFRATRPATILTISDATGSPFAGGLALDGLAVSAAETP
jgi:hypothetical protein